MPQEGIELSMTLDGIEGLRLYDVFSCTGVPVKYFNTGILLFVGVFITYTIIIRQGA